MYACMAGARENLARDCSALRVAITNVRAASMTAPGSYGSSACQTRHRTTQGTCQDDRRMTKAARVRVWCTLASILPCGADGEAAIRPRGRA